MAKIRHKKFINRAKIDVFIWKWRHLLRVCLCNYKIFTHLTGEFTLVSTLATPTHCSFGLKLHCGRSLRKPAVQWQEKVCSACRLWSELSDCTTASTGDRVANYVKVRFHDPLTHQATTGSWLIRRRRRRMDLISISLRASYGTWCIVLLLFHTTQNTASLALAPGSSLSRWSCEWCWSVFSMLRLNPSASSQWTWAGADPGV